VRPPAALIALAVLTWSCGDVPARLCPGTSTARRALLGGVSESRYLLLDRSETGALGALLLPGGRLQCSGALVAPALFLVARHCTDERLPEELTVVLSSGQSWRPVTIRPHPTADVSVLVIDPPARARPLQLIEAVDDSWIGERVEVAGFGASESASRGGSLAFAVERVTALDRTTVTVSAEGLAGACSGDSGGPLLVRGLDGGARVAGLLSEGAASCLGEDRYTRADTLRAWLDPPPATSPSACGGLDAAGRCFHGTAVWCQDGVRGSERCAAPEICRWDSVRSGYRCASPAGDLCRGVSWAGECRDGRAVRCQSGRLRDSDCAACGARCITSPHDGLAGCWTP
jgi:hypothetical protein